MDDLENCQVCHGFWRSTALFLKIIKLKNPGKSKVCLMIDMKHSLKIYTNICRNFFYLIKETKLTNRLR